MPAKKAAAKKTATKKAKPAVTSDPAESIRRAVVALCKQDWGQSPAQIGNASGPGAAMVIEAMARERKAPIFVVVPGPQQRDGIAMDLEVFRPDIPLIEVPPEELKSIRSQEAMAEWLPVLRELVSLPKNKPAVILAVLPSLLTPLPDEKLLVNSSFTLRAGQTIKPGELAKQLDSYHFERVADVENPGQFARRGGVFDLWPHAEEHPIRLDFFGDEIDSLKTFDPDTQRSVASMQTISFPLVPLTERDLGDTLSGLLNYIPAGALPVLVDRRESLLRLNSLKPFWKAKNEKPRVDAIEEMLHGTPRAELTASPVMDRQGALNLNVSEYTPAPGGASAAADSIQEVLRQVARIDVHAGSKGEAKRIAEALESHGIESDLIFSEADEPTGKAVRIVPTEISGSIIATLGEGKSKHGHAMLSGADLFGKQRLRRGLKNDELSLESVHHRAIEDFVRLDTGDYVVHTQHGIARYKGTEEMRTPDGQRGEFLRLEFDGGTEIHVPVANADLVQKYIGSRGVAPKLSRYNSKSWGEKKRAVQESILRLAAEMLEIQALRASESGFAYPRGGEMLHDFVESFPYRDTPDQEQAWADIQGDMEAKRPMDRLLCGDVGFGKTEVAMRAAFKAVLAGKQVAMLAPTTVLVQQHLLSFRERMASYPVTIEGLSRFQTKHQQDATIRKARAGKVDIVIGTHRILSKDVGFHDLGLMIVDEEQKFGVEHKERTKSFRNTVDILTLSATPIPRTLHMALLGIRDITSLTTPPQFRQPVQTSMMRWNENAIREALQHELARDGQVFFLHNRVSDIQDIAATVKRLVPQAEVVYGHGQMPERQLEKTMMKFVNGDADILVSTTIIESGIDVPRANTIFINHANRFGLAELHQLRGRVGRAKHRAYCYLMLPPDQVTSEISEKRLRAILEHSRLGSGFHIAMRDLEIRGAGNIIGNEQSGHIASIGYDLYCRMLERAVTQLRGGEVASEVETTLDIDLDSVLPPSYVKDEAQRVQVYRLIAQTANPVEADAAREILRDRFGKPPKVIEQMLQAAVVRHRLGQLGISSVSVGNNLKDSPGFFRFRAISPNATVLKLQKLAPKARAVDGRTIALPMGRGLDDPRDQLRYLYNMLQMAVSRGILRDIVRPGDELEDDAA